MKKIIKYVIIDILRNKIMIAYTIFLLALSFSIFSLEDNSAKGILGLLNIILIIVPLVSIIFSTIYIYNSAEFIELLVSQPLQRRVIWLSLLAGLSCSISISLLVGIGIPIIIYQFNIIGLIIILIGLLLSIIFIAIAMLTAVNIRDKAKGIGVTILLWLYFSILFDGLVLFILFQFSDYPIEKIMIAISMLNPIDLGRILVLLKMDISALMGYTGAIFNNFFGTYIGLAVSFIVLLSWIIFPVYISTKRFKVKDL